MNRNHHHYHAHLHCPVHQFLETPMLHGQFDWNVVDVTDSQFQVSNDEHDHWYYSLLGHIRRRHHAYALFFHNFDWMQE